MRKIIDAHVHIIPAHLIRNDSGNRVRFERYGRALLPDGSVYQFMPDICADSMFDAATLIRAMDNMGIAKAVIMQAPLYGFLNEDVVDAVRTSPERLAGAMQIDPKDESCLAEMDRYAKAGLSVIKFEMSEGAGFCGMYPDIRLDSPLFMKIWARAEALRLAVTIDPSPIHCRGYQVEALETVTSAFPRLNFIICHLGFPYKGLQENSKDYVRWKRMTALAARDNVWFDISALSTFYQDEAYPFASAAGIVSEFASRYSIRKAIWASDVPGALVFATYRQLLEMFTRSSLFTDADRELLLYENAMAAYRLEEQSKLRLRSSRSPETHAGEEGQP